MTFERVKVSRVFIEFFINILLWTEEMFLNLRFTWFFSVSRGDCYESGPFLSVRFHSFHSYVYNIRNYRSKGASAFHKMTSRYPEEDVSNC